MAACAAALLGGCSKLKDYDLAVKDPTRNGRGFDAPFDAYSGKRDIHPH